MMKALGPIIVDVQSYSLTKAEIERLNHPLVGGVILFSRNFESRAQLTELCAAIHAVRDEPLLIAVDHEGGRVQRFRTDGFTPLPALRSFGRIYDKNPQLAKSAAAQTAYILACELRACGVDLSFTPVLDLDYGISEVIGNRALHEDPEIVTDLASSLIQGLHQAGMVACGKHFPGHGAVAADSHLAIPIDNRSLDEILQADAAPYRWLGDMVLDAVMPAHIIYPQIADEPAGFSARWVTDILRGQLAYDGVVFSDDLTMEGASVAGDITNRALAAFDAGCDMVLVCNRPDLADELLSKLHDFKPPIESIERIRRLMPTKPAMCWTNLMSDPRYIRARRLQSENFSL